MRVINFPEINWEKLKEGAISKEMVWDELEKGVKFLLEVQMLKKTSFLSRDTIEKANEVSGKMRELKDQYPQIIGVIQNILGRKIKEMAGQNGDSRTLFSRLQFLVFEAEFHGSLKEWNEKDLERVPVGLKKNFGVQLYDPRTKESYYFLPYSWRNETHKRTALVLRDLSFKARDTYRTEQRGTTAPQKPVETKPEIPAETQKPKSQPKPKRSAPTPKPRKPVTPSKKDEADKHAAKQVKAVKVKAREKENEVDIRNVRSKSTKDFAEIKSILPAEKK